MTNHARWLSGSHSRTSGGIRKTCSRSHAMKFWAITRWFLNPPDSSPFTRQPHAKAALRRRKPRGSGAFERCAEEDSNLHPVIPDQALNLVTRVSDTSYASVASRSSGNVDVSDVMEDLDVAADVATARVSRA